MNKVQNYLKTDWFEYLYFFMIVIYAGMAVPFTRSMNWYTMQPIGFALPIIMTIILLARNKISFNNNNLFSIIGIYTIWALLQYVIYRQIFLSYSFFAYYNIIIAYIIICVFKTKTFLLYEKIVTQLSIVAIVGWLLMIFIPNILGSIIDSIGMYNDEKNILRGNILIFSMTDLDIYKEDEIFGLPRNSGFSWEPGRFACMLVVALYFNMARTKFNFNKNIGFWILLIALLTTQSTTGYMAFSIVIILILLNKKLESKIFLIPMAIPLVIMVLNLPFIGDKLQVLMNTKETGAKVEEDLAIMERYIKEYENSGYTPQRFDGLAFEFLNILDKPILGYGQDVENSYVNTHISPFLVLSNGLLQVFSRYGIILGGLFYFMLYKSSIWIARFYNIKGGILFMLLYMSISISYDFILIPFFIVAMLFGLLAEKKWGMKIETKSYQKKGFTEIHA